MVYQKEHDQVGKVSKPGSSNVFVSRYLLPIESLFTRYNVYLGLVVASMMLVVVASGITASLEDNIVAQPLGICDRTEEVADSIVAEVQNTRPEATCADITGDELGSVEGPISIAPATLQSGDFFGLTSLTELKIAGTDLVLLRAGTFSGLDNLETLAVQSPSLTTAHSGVFNGLPNIKTLRLQSNNLKALPRDIFAGMGGLQTLRIYSNSLRSLSIGVFSGLDSLRTLDLHTGGIKNLSHGVLTGMPNLRALHFRNEDTSVLESGAFSGLDNLQWLYLEGSGITKMGSAAFAGLHNLRRLYLNDNKIATLPDGVFRHLKSITHLHLHDNALETLPSGSFDGLDQLQELFIHDNNINRLPADIFKGIDSLEIIHLDRNQLTELPDDLVKGLGGLKDLTFFYNELSDVSDLDLSDAVNLRWIDFDGNMLTALPEDLFLSPPCSLRIVGLAGNQFDGVPSATIDGVDYDILDVLPQASTTGCTPEDGITDLWIDEISLSIEDLAKVRDDFTKLELLSMRETGLTSKAAIDFLANHASTTLDSINLSSNDLSDWNTVDHDAMAEAFKKNKSLTTLRMSDTEIDGDTAMSILESVGEGLIRVDFSENDLSGLSEPDVQERLGEAFARLPKSDWWFIDLDETGIDTTAAGTILTNAARVSGERDYAHIQIAGNQIAEIDPDWFADWEVLSDFHLSDNQLTTFDPSILAPFADGMYYLYLDGNPLDPIPSADEIEAVLPNLIELELPTPSEPEIEEEAQQLPQEGLPRTGGGMIPVNTALLMLALGLAAIIAGAALAISNFRVLRTMIAR